MVVDHRSLVGVENQHRHLVECMVGVAEEGVDHEEDKVALVVEVAYCVFDMILDDRTDRLLVEGHTERLACRLEQHLQDLHFL